VATRIGIVKGEGCKKDAIGKSVQTDAALHNANILEPSPNFPPQGENLCCNAASLVMRNSSQMVKKSAPCKTSDGFIVRGTIPSEADLGGQDANDPRRLSQRIQRYRIHAA
jgi:hypothetical protein